ncbi:MAG TPA: hypothetical protein VKA68_02960 [bacterium]|nr:hypothetical protein [bacterium]
MRNRRFIPVSVLVVFMGLLFAYNIYAHPGFARKYRMSCTTCHNPAPRLKPFGDEFAGNAFVMEGEEPARFHPDTGDDLLLLQALPPIGFRLDAYARYIPDADGSGMSGDFQVPYLVKFLSGGRLAEKVAYYFYFYLSEHGEVAGVEDAYLYFADFLGSPIGMTVGQFQVSDPLFKRELRLTFEDYIIYTTKVGPNIPLDLGYDRGVMLDYTAPFGSDFLLEILNGNGIGELERGFYDENAFKNVALRWSHDLNLFRIGAFGYYGKSSVGGNESNITNWYGPDATVELGPVEFNLQYLWRTDDNPYPAAPKPDDPVITHGSMAEAIFAPRGDRSRWYLVGLFNYRTSDIRDYFIGAPDLEYQTAGLAANYLLARNFRLLMEYNYDIYNQQNRFTVGFFSAF